MPEDPPRKHGRLHSGVGYTAPKVVPYEAGLRRAADILNAGSKVAMLPAAYRKHGEEVQNGTSMVTVASGAAGGIERSANPLGVPSAQ
jgi:pyruvate dehydrogenase (quinone)